VGGEDFFDQDDHLPKDCPQCGHENGAMGSLGKTLQFCCRACGWWYN
jgi:tRNA(Ile2) C34 agmatinyltransferase TiaS